MSTPALGFTRKRSSGRVGADERVRGEAVVRRRRSARSRRRQLDRQLSDVGTSKVLVLGGRTEDVVGPRRPTRAPRSGPGEADPRR
jgi:hypothetical protein